MTQITLNPVAIDQEHRARVQAWALHCAEQAGKAKARRDLRAWGWWSQAAAEAWEELA